MPITDRPAAVLCVALALAAAAAGCAGPEGIARARARSAVEAAREGEFGEARRLLDDAEGRAPGLPDVAFARGAVEEAGGRLDAAVGWYLRALDLSPTFFPARIGLGSVYGRQGRFAEAEGEFAAVVAAEPDMAHGWLSLGMARIMGGDPEGAVVALEGGIELHPGNADLHMALGRARYESGDRPGAVESLRTVLRLDPGREKARQVLAQIEAETAPR